MRNYYHSKRDLLLHTIYNSPLAAYATISEENAASTEETSASVIEVTDIVNRISENVNELRQIAEQLEARMSDFILE